MSVALGIARLYSPDDPDADLPAYASQLLDALRALEHPTLGDSAVSVDDTSRTLEMQVTAAAATEDEVVTAGKAAIDQAVSSTGLQLTAVGEALMPRPPGWQPSGQ